MQDFYSSGEAARLLGATEPELNSLIRRSKLHPLPPLMAGRRLWGREHIERAAAALGVPVPRLPREPGAGQGDRGR